jgi:hypothetical protein
MYATCLFCNRDLGRNQTLETFPVGKRLAFDPAKGRLWVVCKQCERWNLSPLEERWEAIEAAERLYAETRRRVSTDEIGLARLRDGTELVRIGKPLRPEFAAWRYGDQFGRRRRRQLILAGGGLAAIGAVVIGGAVVGVGIGGFGVILARSVKAVVDGSPDAVVAKVRTDNGAMLRVRRRHLAQTALSRGPDGALAIDLQYETGHFAFHGREAERVASVVIPTVNRFGASKAAVADAVSVIEKLGGAEGYLDRLSRDAAAQTQCDPDATDRWALLRQRNQPYTAHGLFGLPSTDRLALEMALHEETERRALTGELVELERAWRDAEEIAGISDDLLLPPNVEATIEAIRRSNADEASRLTGPPD